LWQILILCERKKGKKRKGEEYGDYDNVGGGERGGGGGGGGASRYNKNLCGLGKCDFYLVF